MPLSLIAGPANAGKVELLLDRYLASLEREPTLIVPNRSDVDRVERDLLRRRPCLLAGSIGTFDDVFERIARSGEGVRPLLSAAQRALLVRRALAGADLDGLAASARFAGFADALLHELHLLPFDQFALGFIRAALGKAGRLGNLMQLFFRNRPDCLLFLRMPTADCRMPSDD